MNFITLWLNENTTLRIKKSAIIATLIGLDNDEIDIYVKGQDHPFHVPNTSTIRDNLKDFWNDNYN